MGGQGLLPTDLLPLLSPPPPRLETLSMRFTVLMIRVLMHLDLMPRDEGLYEYLAT